MTRKLTTLASAAALALLAACSSSPSMDSTSVGQTTYPTGSYTTQMGRVTSIQVVDVAQPPGLGTVLGAVIGAAAGNQVGSGTGRAAATVGGAVAGGVIGHQIEKRNANDVFRVSVQFDDGTTRNFHFERVEDLRVGDRVRYDGQQLYRA